MATSASTSGRGTEDLRSSRRVPRKQSYRQVVRRVITATHRRRRGDRGAQSADGRANGIGCLPPGRAPELCAPRFVPFALWAQFPHAKRSAPRRSSAIFGLGHSRHAPTPVVRSARITGRRIAAMRTAAHSCTFRPVALPRMAAADAVRPPIERRGRAGRLRPCERADARRDRKSSAAIPHSRLRPARSVAFESARAVHAVSGGPSHSPLVDWGSGRV